MVLRDGGSVATLPAKEVDVNKVISLMIGRSLTQQFPQKERNRGEVVLRVEKLSSKGHFREVSFELHRGEILGIAGLAGSGKGALLRALFGARKYDGGQVWVAGQTVKIDDVTDAVKNRIAFVPAERKTEGLFLQQGIDWNLSIAGLERIGKVQIDKRAEVDHTKKFIRHLSIKASSPDQAISGLSGGNQQKVMLARWLLIEPEVLLLGEPTRGIDVNAKADVYKVIVESVKGGKGVIIVSADGPELLGVCHRILVMFEGEVAKELDAAEANEELLAYYSVDRRE